MSRMTHPPRLATTAALLLAIPMAATAATADLAAPAALAGPTAVPRLISCAGRAMIRPTAEFVFDCADANVAIRGERWSSWGRSEARGTAELDINLCKPTCVQSSTSVFKDSRVRLFDVERTASGPAFSRAAITYSRAGRESTVIAYPRT